jgi:hypothetical protein
VKIAHSVLTVACSVLVPIEKMFAISRLVKCHFYHCPSLGQSDGWLILHLRRRLSHSWCCASCLVCKSLVGEENFPSLAPPPSGSVDPPSGRLLAPPLLPAGIQTPVSYKIFIYLTRQLCFDNIELCFYIHYGSRLGHPASFQKQAIQGPSSPNRRVLTRLPSRNFLQFRLAEQKIRLIAGLAGFSVK